MHYRGLLALLAVPCAITVVAHAAPTHATLPLADSAWHDDPPGLPAGSRFAVISGDPAKAGPFVIRVELPSGSFVRLPAHELHFMSTESGATVQIFGAGPFKQLSTSASNGAAPRIGSATGNPKRALSVASNR